MTKGLIDGWTLRDIADSINQRSGDEEEYYPSEMPQAILDIPNVFTALDEGKVVNNSALVSQTSVTKTENGTYDTTLNNQVIVAVPDYDLEEW